MWGYDKENLKKEIKGGNSVNKNGCYHCVIEKAYVFRSEKTSSEALTLVMKTNEDEKLRLNIFYKDKSGNPISYNEKHLNHLEYLCKLKHEQMQVQAEQYEHKTRDCFKALEWKEIGVIVEVESAEKGYNYFLKGFFEPKTRKSVAEIVENKEAAIVMEYFNLYIDAEPVKAGKKENKSEDAYYGQMADKHSEEEGDAFPF